MFLSRAHTIRCWTKRAACAGISALAAWSVLALGDDLLARKVHLDIPAEPLASALMQLSTQAGMQVVATDKDIANLQTGGVKGDYTIEEALKLLLQQTGLSFSPSGNGTVAIRSVSQSAAHSDAAQADVNVINPGELPPAQALSGSSLVEFIRHHGTTYTLDNDPFGPVRWRGGKGESLCPVTVGLDPVHNDFVSARIRAVAAYVGAPVATDSRCQANVEVIFTSEPRKPLQETLRRAESSAVSTDLVRPISATLDLSDQHPIQGFWRLVGTLAILNTEGNLIRGGLLRAVWQPTIPRSSLAGSALDRLKGPYGGPSILNSLLVINTQKLDGAHMGTIADYLAFVTLSIAQNPDHCDPLASILDLMSATCAQRPAPTTLTAADLAFLKAVYSHRSPDMATRTEGEIEAFMREQLTGHKQQ